eukprot:symbB.v1.2.003591.t1/scaffold202.1/size271277/2
MFGRVSRAVRPRLVRPVSQVLAEPMAWNQAPVVVTTLANGVKVASKETFAEVMGNSVGSEEGNGVKRGEMVDLGCGTLLTNTDHKD